METQSDYELAPEMPRGGGGKEGDLVGGGGRPLGYASPAGRGPVEGERLKDWNIPIALLAGGLVVEVVGALITRGRSAGAMAAVGIDVVVTTGLMLVGVLLAARWRQIRLGDFRIVVLKLAALAVAPSALVLLATPVLRFVPLGGLIGLGGEFVLYFALMGVLFDLDESDTWYCVWVIFLVRVGAYFLLLGVMARWG